jgi:hypothetical protein
MLIGGPCVCPRPFNSGVFALRSGGQIVATVKIDKHGRFSLNVPAGRYRIATIRSAPYALRPRTIHVSADRTTQVVLRFSI